MNRVVPATLFRHGCNPQPEPDRFGGDIFQPALVVQSAIVVQDQMVSRSSIRNRYPLVALLRWEYTLRRFGTEEMERTMPYIVVLVVTLLFVAGCVLFVMTPARPRKPPITR